jgi:hypothetical protein
MMSSQCNDTVNGFELVMENEFSEQIHELSKTTIWGIRAKKMNF